ncbi:MAG: VWA domain-containing protein [Bacteroidetes bacterium]|nr:MAG: VWA domain-containing protein [Bacteroidota bacterium]
MFIPFFFDLRKHGVKTSLKEFLHLMEALKKGVTGPSIEEFYYLSRSILVKHEGQLDRFDLLFGKYFQGKTELDEDFWANIPEEWLRAQLARALSQEDIDAIESMGGLDALMERFKQLMQEQQERHQGGNKWIGTGGTSPFGNSGFNPEGFRIGKRSGKHGNALKVWEKRQYANLDDRVELNTRNMKMILKRLRELTREGIPNELDMKGTIRKTSENAGMLDISMIPSRKNRVKVLMLFDVGGSMDPHVELCSRLFSAARHEFKHLEYYYFHNCLYERVWKDNRRRGERISTWDLIHKYNKDYKLIFVGDAAMSPIEIMYKGGSVEYWNEEPGMVWLQRMKAQFPHLAWINPTPAYEWRYYESTEILRKFLDFRMFPMTMEGITLAMKSLKNPKIKFGNESDAATYH